MVIDLFIDLSSTKASQNAPATINTRSATEKAGTVEVTIEFNKLVIWENSIIYKEFCAAVLVGMEKRKTALPS